MTRPLKIRYMKGKLPKELGNFKNLVGAYLSEIRMIIINLNNIESPLHFKWALTHELGHDYMMHDGGRSAVHKEEIEANLFSLMILGKREYRKAIKLYWPTHIKRYPTVKECLELAK